MHSIHSAVSEVDLFSAMSYFGCSTVSSARINFQGISKPCVKQWHTGTKEQKDIFPTSKDKFYIQNCFI